MELEYDTSIWRDDVEELDLLDYEIDVIPKGWNPLKLKVLHLENNNVEAIPSEWNPPNLQELYLENNRITSLPDGWNPPNLKKLDLGDNLVGSKVILPKHLLDLARS